MVLSRMTCSGGRSDEACGRVELEERHQWVAWGSSGDKLKKTWTKAFLPVGFHVRMARR